MNIQWTNEQIFEDSTENKIFGVAYSFKKSKIKIKGRKPKTFALTFVILLVCLIFLVANLTTNIISVSSSTSNALTLNSSKYYAISISSFSSKELATQTSQEIKKIGGGGYILSKNNKYYVLTSVYQKESSAVSVSNKLINLEYSPEILEISTKQLNYSAEFSALNHEKANTISNLINIFDASFEKINYLSVQFDQSQLTLAECKKECLELFEKYYPLHKEYLNICENINSEKISALTKSLHIVLEKLEALSQVSVDNTYFSSTLKNALTTIVVAKSDLI